MRDGPKDMEDQFSGSGCDVDAFFNLLRDHNKSGKRKLPADLQMPFSAKHWPKSIVEGGQPKRRVYETAVVATLRDRLRAGDVWVEGSQDYRRFDSYLISRETAGAELRKHGLETDADAWFQDRRYVLNHRLAIRPQSRKPCRVTCHHFGRGEQSWSGTDGLCIQACQPFPTDLWKYVVFAVRNLHRRSGQDCRWPL